MNRNVARFAGLLFIAEGVAILFYPDLTISAYCRRHPWAWEIAESLLDIHRGGLL
jgi:hypothetical protein